MSDLARAGVKSGPSKNGQLPSSTLVGVGKTCEPDNETDAPSSVPDAVVVPEIAVQSANWRGTTTSPDAAPTESPAATAIAASTPRTQATNRTRNPRANDPISAPLLAACRIWPHCRSGAPLSLPGRTLEFHPWGGRAPPSCRREPMSSLRYVLPRCISTVLTDRNSVWAISLLDAPAAANRAIRRSDGVSASVPSRRRG